MKIKVLTAMNETMKRAAAAYHKLEAEHNTIGKIYGEQHDIKMLKKIATETIYTLQEIINVLYIGVKPGELEELREIALKSSEEDSILESFGISSHPKLSFNVRRWKHPDFMANVDKFIKSCEDDHET
jgi:hypothetical protein